MSAYDAFQMGYQKAMSYYPRPPAQWKQLNSGGYVCSSCGIPVKARFLNDYLFCPYCGARMVGMSAEEGEINEEAGTGGATWTNL